MKPLIMLFLLDYSGSMDQALEGKTKMEGLKTEVKALLSAGRDSDLDGALVFGLDAKTGCEKIDFFEDTPEQLSQKLRSLKAGKFGKTPLALGLKKTVEMSVVREAEQVIAVTDGADSCGMDPCKALQDSDKMLDGKRPLRLHIIGYDLKNDSAKLACLKNLNLKNIKVALSEVGGTFDLQEKIKEGQKVVLDLDEKNDSDPLEGIKGAKVVGRRASANQKGKNNKSLKKPRPAPDEALLEVTGAPSTAQFQAISGQGKKRNWFGSYVIDLKPGIHRVSFKDANSTELKIPMSGGTLTKLPWARLMKLSSGQVAVQMPLLSLKWSATKQTQEIHGEVAEVVSPVNLTSDKLVIPPLPFGEWQVEVVEPRWLEGKIPARRVKVNLGANPSLNLEKLFGDEVIWVNNPNPGMPSVAKLIEASGQETRFLVPPGQKRIPIKNDTKVEWLQ